MISGADGDLAPDWTGGNGMTRFQSNGFCAKVRHVWEDLCRLQKCDGFHAMADFCCGYGPLLLEPN